MQAESNAESSCRSFLHYFQPALYKAATCLKVLKLDAFWVVAIDRFYHITMQNIPCSINQYGTPICTVAFPLFFNELCM